MEEVMEEVMEEQEQKKDFCPFDYVTIPLKEYRRLLKRVAKFKVKAEKEHCEMMNYWRQANEAKENLEEAKAQIRKLMGLEEVIEDADI